MIIHMRERAALIHLPMIAYDAVLDEADILVSSVDATWTVVASQQEEVPLACCRAEAFRVALELLKALLLSD